MLKSENAEAQLGELVAAERTPAPGVLLIFEEKARERSALRLWDLQLAANGASSAFLNFAVSRNGSDLAIGRVFPDRMIAAFAGEGAAVGAQMTLQVEPFHDVASRSSSRTAPGVMLLRASSRW